MNHLTVVDQGLLNRALTIVQGKWVRAINDGLTARTGRPRTHQPSTVLHLLAIAAMESCGSVLLTDAADVARRLNPRQRQQIDLHSKISFQYISRTLTHITEGLVSRVNAITGEIHDPRIQLPPSSLFSLILRGVIPARLASTPSQAIDSTDIEAEASRLSFTADGKPDVDVDALPELEYVPEKLSRSEPGWPKIGPDGRAQNSIDSDARDGYRSGKNRGRKEVFIGYDAHLSVDVASCGGNYVPALIRGLVFAPAGSSKTAAGTELIDTLRACGDDIREVIVDRGYSYGSVDNWAVLLQDREVSQVFDLHPNQRRRKQGPKPGTLYIDGTLFSTALPERLRDLPRFTLNMTNEAKAALVTRYDERAVYAFRPIEEPDFRGRKQRYRGPAVHGAVRCPNSGKSMRIDAAKKPLTNCTPGEQCGCGITIRLQADDELRTRQWHIYGTKKWAESYGRRNAVETANALIKQHYANTKRRSIRVRGLLKGGLLLAILIATVNITILRKLYDYDVGAPPADDVAIIARPTKSKALHRGRGQSRAPDPT